MIGAEQSAEEFFTRRVSDAQVLLDCSHRHAADGDVVAAMATALASDTATLQALLWERINIAPRAPLRQLFQAADALTETMLAFEHDEPAARASAADVVVAARQRMIDAFDDALVADALRGWPDVEYLAGFAAPTVTDLDASVDARTGGVPVPEFVILRRSAAARAMLDAQSSRVRGATSEAIGKAYDSDFLALEAYLTESAWALGDSWLLTAVARWDLATHAVGLVGGLPDGFVDAVGLVRRTMADALGDADGARLRDFFEPA